MSEPGPEPGADAKPAGMAESDAERDARVLMVYHRTVGGVIALDALLGSLANRLQNVQGRRRLKVGKTGELLVREAEITDVLAFVHGRAKRTAEQARGLALAHPKLIGEAYGGPAEPAVATQEVAPEPEVDQAVGPATVVP